MPVQILIIIVFKPLTIIMFHMRSESESVRGTEMVIHFRCIYKFIVSTLKQYRHMHIYVVCLEMIWAYMLIHIYRHT